MVSLPFLLNAERRGTNRYPLAFELGYRVLSENHYGRGRTLNISSNGVLFQSDVSLPIGTQIVMTIRWPVLLHDVCPLNLVMTGRVIRSELPTVAVQVHTYEFKTAGKSLITSAA